LTWLESMPVALRKLHGEMNAPSDGSGPDGNGATKPPTPRPVPDSPGTGLASTP
jgi:hypothetical protein